jgi:hypothetical protein
MRDGVLYGRQYNDSLQSVSHSRLGKTSGAATITLLQMLLEPSPPPPLPPRAGVDDGA